jgi:hypothetical protein
MAKQTTVKPEDTALPAVEDEVSAVAAVPPAAAAAAPAPEPEAEVRIGVSEFCTRRLDADPRAYAGLYAFQRREEKEGRVMDTIKAYERRYNDMMGSHPKH